jgi:protein-S-isoprenylcysteine O-methyltransferase Ste14
MDLKIPPLAILVITLIGQYEIADYLPVYSLGIVPLWVPILWGCIGILLAFLGVIEFRRHKTTVNPMNPSSSDALVTRGIYNYTRNPMYLGMASICVGFVFFLAELSSLAGVIFFVLYINEFQIKPEERFMFEKFGDNFTSYKSQVRRWL